MFNFYAPIHQELLFTISSKYYDKILYLNNLIFVSVVINLRTEIRTTIQTVCNYSRCSLNNVTPHQKQNVDTEFSFYNIAKKFYLIFFYVKIIKKNVKVKTKTNK